MRPISKISIASVWMIGALFVAGPSFADDTSITTYYPAPAGGSATASKVRKQAVGSDAYWTALDSAADGTLLVQGPFDLGLGNGQMRFKAQTSGTPWTLFIAQPTTPGWIGAFAAYPKGATTSVGHEAHGVQNVGSALELMGTDYAADTSHYHDFILLEGSNRIGFVSRATGTIPPTSVYEVAPDFVFTSTSNTLGEHDLMAITADGNVGIGTTTPKFGLSIPSQIRVLGIGGDGSASIYSYGALFLGNNRATATAGDTVGQISFQSQNNPGNPQVGSIISYLEGSGGSAGFGSFMVFTTKQDNGGNGERMRITNVGNVGIGTTPGFRLDVADTGTAANVRALNVTQSGASTGQGYAAYITKTGASSIGNVGLFVKASGATINTSLEAYTPFPTDAASDVAVDAQANKGVAVNAGVTGGRAIYAQAVTGYGVYTTAGATGTALYVDAGRIQLGGSTATVFSKLMHGQVTVNVAPPPNSVVPGGTIVRTVTITGLPASARVFTNGQGGASGIIIVTAWPTADTLNLMFRNVGSSTIADQNQTVDWLAIVP